MLMLETALRGGTIVLLLFLALILLRDARGSLAGRFGALFALGGAAYALCSSSVFLTAPPAWLLPLHILAIGNPVVFWLLSASLFDDDFSPSWWHAAAWLFVVANGLVIPAIGGASLQFICIALALACNGMGAWYAIAGRGADLVESRRRLRSLLIVLVAVYSVVTLVPVVAWPGTQWPPLALANAAGLLAITLAFAVALIAVNPDGGILSLPVAAASQSPPAAQPVARRGTSLAAVERDEDGALLALLRRAMEHDRLYRAEGLSIGSLATKLGAPEHRLRRLINRQLGYRNFNAFLNGYRLADVTSALADPAQEAVPILTIALDAGFQSLGPFNRAFKAETGLTPSEFRRQKLMQTAQIAAE
jgi:AraC-like DNA-binding protein